MWPWAILLIISAPETALSVLATIILAVAIPLATIMLAGIVTFWSLASLDQELGTRHTFHARQMTDGHTLDPFELTTNCSPTFWPATSVM